MGLDEEDFSNFDPKVYWAAKNNEIIPTTASPGKTKAIKNSISHEEKVRRFLRTNEGKLWTALYKPLTMIEMAQAVGLTLQETEWTFSRLKKYYRCKIGRGRTGTIRNYFTIDRDMTNLWL